ncbi:MAG: invasion protein IalB [Parasphingorhabdus sp.]|jgi:invasion protein IalB
MRLLFLLLLNTVLISAPVQSQDISEDWARICEDRGAFKGKCYISQTLKLKKSGKKLFQIAAGYPLEGDLPLILVSAPLGIYLPAGIIMQIDKTEAYKAIVAYCNIDGCHAYYRMSERFERLFQQGRWLNVSYLDGTRRENQFKVSLNGFTSALQQLNN